MPLTRLKKRKENLFCTADPELYIICLKMRKDEKQKSYNQKFRGGRALSNEHHESSQKCLLEEISAIEVSG